MHTFSMASPSHTRVCAKCTLVYSEKCSSLQHQESQNPDQAQSNTAISATQREMSTAVTDWSQALFSLHLLCGKFETNFQKESNFTDEENGADCNQISRTLKSPLPLQSVRETLVYYWVCGLLLATVKSEGEHLTATDTWRLHCGCPFTSHTPPAFPHLKPVLL